MANLENLSLDRLICTTNGINDLLVQALSNPSAFDSYRGQQWQNFYFVMILNSDILEEIKRRIPDNMINDS